MNYRFLYVRPFRNKIP